MTDASLMRGNDWVRCCICGELHADPYPDLAVDDGGVVWDVCAGGCARESGLIEAEQSRRDFLTAEGRL